MKETMETFSVEAIARVKKETVGGEPLAEILGQIQEFSMDKRVSYETRRWART